MLGMNRQTFPQNPRKRGKSRQHVWLLNSFDVFANWPQTRNDVWTNKELCSYLMFSFSLLPFFFFFSAFSAAVGITDPYLA